MTGRIPRISICVPTRDLTAAEFTHSLVKMVGRFCTHFVGKGQAEIIELFDLGTLLPDMRNTLARKSIELGATHILWLDSDMIFPEDTIERLYQHGKPIVAASYSQRKEPAKPVAAKDGVWVYTEEGSSGIEKVDFVGMGCMLVETAVYEAMDEPWHCLGWNEAKGTIVGEDVYFCRKAAQVGAETWIDHDLSKEIGHIGYRTFSYLDALKDRPLLLAKQGGGDGVRTHHPQEA
ncbi:MAG: hypothetical protein WA975_03360 [Mesorhizobium sp.]